MAIKANHRRGSLAPARQPLPREPGVFPPDPPSSAPECAIGPMPPVRHGFRSPRASSPVLGRPTIEQRCRPAWRATVQYRPGSSRRASDRASARSRMTGRYGGARHSHDGASQNRRREEWAQQAPDVAAPLVCQERIGVGVALHRIHLSWQLSSAAFLRPVKAHLRDRCGYETARPYRTARCGRPAVPSPALTGRSCSVREPRNALSSFLDW